MRPPSQSSLTALSYLEWINIISEGEIRINSSRIIDINALNNAKYNDFSKIFDEMPDISITDDAGYVLTLLKSDYKELFVPVKSNPDTRVRRLELSQVDKFYPLSDRGERILQTDAVKYNIILEKPLYEDYWDRWRGEEALTRDKLRSLRFVNTFFEPGEFSSAQHFESVIPLDYYENIIYYLKSIFERKNIFTVHRIEPFKAATKFIKDVYSKTDSDPNNTFDFSKIKEYLKMQDTFNEYFKLTDESLPVFHDQIFLNKLRYLNHQIYHGCVHSFDLLFLLPVFHYSFILNSEMEMNYPSFLKDVSVINKLNGSKAAASALFIIGRMIPADQVNAIHRAARAGSFPVLKNPPAPDFPLRLENYLEDIDLPKISAIIEMEENGKGTPDATDVETGVKGESGEIIPAETPAGKNGTANDPDETNEKTASGSRDGESPANFGDAYSNQERKKKTGSNDPANDEGESPPDASPKTAREIEMEENGKGTPDATDVETGAKGESGEIIPAETPAGGMAAANDPAETNEKNPSGSRGGESTANLGDAPSKNDKKRKKKTGSNEPVGGEGKSPPDGTSGSAREKEEPKKTPPPPPEKDLLKKDASKRGRGTAKRGSIPVSSNPLFKDAGGAEKAPRRK
ncbi:MAG: hypothetical protein LBR53_12435 [Deltaproteobacteria bacterium]|jgi:hypothetical protein|nr:hypothetical protein [Deltaproteobacteria bacterium]